jgi:beta-mannosidase
MIRSKGIFFLLLLLSFTSIGQKELSWRFFHPLKKEWLPYQTHGSIQEKLIQSGELPAPFYRDNEFKFDWVELNQWKLIADTIASEYDSPQLIDIHLPEIDTYASIYWNDSLVLLAENAFRPYQFQVVLMPNSKNTITAVFTPPILYHKNRFETERFHYPAPNDSKSIAVANLTRKPQYQFGWDWTARMNTIGFTKPVSWKYQKSNSLTDFSVQSTYDGKDAEVTYHFLFSPIENPITIKSSLFGDFEMKTNDTLLDWKNTLVQPKLWWPRGWGESFIYRDTIQVFTSNESLIETRYIHFGVRSSELIQQVDKWGTSYVIQLNDKPIFCKGANLIPPSVFTSQLSDSVWEGQIQVIKEQQLNMVRIWGGGIYPSDYFLTRCDEEGIMVWQDLMFACAMYPADSLFLLNVKSEMEYQIPRLASHPSVVLFNGNNEVDVAWKNWGLQKQYGLSVSDSIQIGNEYRILFQENIPNWIKSFTDIPYVHTSPLSNWGAPERYNHGSQHYWGVWHGNDPIAYFSNNIGRFNAEFGYQSFPEYSTLLALGAPETWNLDSLGIKTHQKSYVGNGKIHSEIKKSYSPPKNFMEFVYYSQLIQGDAMEQAVSAHRLNAPRCMGSIYWQLNDCYPAPTWSSVDYLGNRKIMHYRMKQVMQAVTVLHEEDKNGFNLHFVSDVSKSISIKYSINAIRKINGKWINNKLISDSLQLEFLNNKSIFSREELNQYFISNSTHGLEVCWELDGQKYNRIFWIKNQPPHKVAYRDVKLKISKIDRKNKSLILKLKAKHPIQHFWLYSTQKGIRYSENDMTILPGKKEIEIHFETLPSLKDFKWFGLQVGE